MICEPNFEQGYQVANVINRYSLGTRNNLSEDPADHSVTVYIQRSIDESDPKPPP
ncbi:MAG TPA: hypothetical protein VNO30_09015 [Kofleriaceae bacterium]|nr:hypothetical protein [Kofleriaceae bacterium]